MLAVDVLDAPEAARCDRRLVCALGDGRGSSAGAGLGRHAEFGGVGEGPREPGQEAGHAGGHGCGGCYDSEEGDGEREESDGVESEAVEGLLWRGRFVLRLGRQFDEVCPFLLGVVVRWGNPW